LDASYEALAQIVGFETLVSQDVTVRDDNWKPKSYQAKGKSFKSWVERSNEPTLIIIDDADTVDEKAIEGFIQPQKARTLILSTRNPNLLPSRISRKLPLDILDPAEAATLLNSRGVICSDDDLQKLVNYLGNHPLGIQHAMEFISKQLVHSLSTTRSPAQIFLDLFSSPEHESRRLFLETKYFQNRSILDCYQVSVNRLPSEDRDSSLSLLRFAAFLKSEKPENDIFHFLGAAKEWWQYWQKLDGQLDDFKLLSMSMSSIGDIKQSKYIKDLVEVSLLTVSGQKRDIHCLWAECIRQLANEKDRVRCVKQIILICDTIFNDSPEGIKERVIETLLPYVQACDHVLKTFGINFNRVRPPQYPQNLNKSESYVAYWTYSWKIFKDLRIAGREG
jgi:hypothetical protein